ncbi:MAG TPA: hypothetical protein PKH19_06520, partial [Candidatus Syntrophosphaera sp.]|nr:hypothetical protein [Candidatus Syntrophosphaera sp.]
MKLWLLLLLLLPALLAGELAFEAETLDFRLESLPAGGDTLLWTVSGDYYFSNLGQDPLSRPIWFPIPADSSAGRAEILDLSLIDPADSMSVELLKQNVQGLMFRLALPARSFARLRLSYRQRVYGSEVRYILKTANAWGRPLPHSTLNLFVSNSIELAGPPYPDPHLAPVPGGTRYLWQLPDFVPQSDFVVSIIRP